MKSILPVLNIAVIVFIMTACSSNEIGNSRDVDPQAIFIEYTITQPNPGDDVWCRAQYRFGGKNGTTLLINSPGKVELDGQLMEADSSFFSGAYYQRHVAVNKFTGEHTLSFTDVNGKTYNEKFSFHPVICNAVPETLARQKGLSFTASGFIPGDTISLAISDTAASSPDIISTRHVINGAITVSPAELEHLYAGPLVIRLWRQADIPLSNPTSEGGHIIFDFQIGEYRAILKD